MTARSGPDKCSTPMQRVYDLNDHSSVEDLLLAFVGLLRRARTTTVAEATTHLLLDNATTLQDGQPFFAFCGYLVASGVCKAIHISFPWKAVDSEFKGHTSNDLDEFISRTENRLRNYNSRGQRNQLSFTSSTQDTLMNEHRLSREVGVSRPWSPSVVSLVDDPRDVLVLVFHKYRALIYVP